MTQVTLEMMRTIEELLAERDKLRDQVQRLKEGLLRFMGLRYHVGEEGNRIGDACAFCDSMQVVHLPLGDGSPCPVEGATALLTELEEEKV